MIEKLKSNKLSTKALVAVLYVSGPIFLMSTDPTTLPLPLLILPFLWLFAVLFYTTIHIFKNRVTSHRRRVIIACVVATLPVLLLIFQSIHQLSPKDVLLAIGLVVVASFYLQRADFIH